MEDYKKTSFHYSGKTKTFKTFNQEMGYTEELMHFFDAIKGKTSLAITPQEIFLSTLSVFKICEAIEKGQPMPIENSR